ncbi:MAG: hypothetical protein EOO16_12320 [Chitinophagaceae bacterium]|nr:MAG: hypothetical protein EOO16_12320 [Chitinophagaceae bacterium]
MDRILNAFSARGYLLASAAFHYLPGSVEAEYNEFKSVAIDGHAELPDTVIPITHHVAELDYRPFADLVQVEMHDRAFIAGMLHQDAEALGPLRYAYSAEPVHTRCLAFSGGRTIGIFDIASYILQGKKQVSFYSAEAAELDRVRWVGFFEDNREVLVDTSLDPALGPFSVGAPA